MNFLAHLHLGSGEHPGTAAGNLLADFRRLLPPMKVDESVEAGLRLHRRIDALADAHPLHRQARRCLDTPRRHLAGIMVDVFCDHFLTRNWSRFADRPLFDFVASELERVNDYLLLNQPDYAPLLTRLRNGRWLLAYDTVEGLGRVFARMAERSPALARLAGAEGELRTRGPELERLFLDFYPDLMARCAAPGLPPPTGG